MHFLALGPWRLLRATFSRKMHELPTAFSFGSARAEMTSQGWPCYSARLVCPPRFTSAGDRPLACSGEVAPAYVTANDIMEFDLDSSSIDLRRRALHTERFLNGGLVW
jgi:hypothetical protein